MLLVAAIIDYCFQVGRSPWNINLERREILLSAELGYIRPKLRLPKEGVKIYSI